MALDHPSTRDPDGRLVVFDAGTWLHLAYGRPKLLGEVDVILGTVAHPDHRVDDPITGREQFYRRDLDPRRWLRVDAPIVVKSYFRGAQESGPHGGRDIITVVDFSDVPAWVVTALVQWNPPRDWRP